MAAPRTLLAIFAGGALGALARTGLSELLGSGTAWPWATFAVNLFGAAVLGCVTALLARESPALDAELAHPLLATGFCGGLTTFSTLQLEAVELLDDGRVGLAVGYLTATVVGGLAGVAAGRRLGRGEVHA